MAKVEVDKRRYGFRRYSGRNHSLCNKKQKNILNAGCPLIQYYIKIMDQLEQARRIEASDGVRKGALTRFRNQVAEWGIAIPETAPLVLDFGLNRFESVGLTESWIANEIDAGYCGKYLFVSDGQTCPTHQHRQKHETFFVVEGRVNVVYAGQEIELSKGQVLAVPPLVKHCFTGVGAALLLELSQPCLIADNYFDDERIPIGGNYQGTE